MNNKITCPDCGFTFDVEEALSKQLDAHYKIELKQQLLKAEERMQSEKERMVREEMIKFQQKAEEQVSVKMQLLEKENADRKAENLLLKKKEIDLLRAEAALKERQEEMKLEIDRKMLERQAEIEAKARAKASEDFEIEKTKLLKQIDDNKKLAEEMKRKAEQGSMQLQGESQELAIEKLLESAYPFDNIDEVPKGIRGADCIQTVINSFQQDCGTIVYESKNTKSFGGDWFDKLKQDQLACKADIAVLVTQTYPKGMDRFGEKDGVWICGFQELKSLSFVLRQMLIKTQAVRSSEDNKGDKMELLYSYFTSNEFKQNVKRIVENYDKMFEQLNREKKAMNKLWAEREGQIWVVQENLAALFGKIRGIAGKELEEVDVLQLTEKESE